MLRTPDVNLAGLRSLCALADKALQANDLDKVNRLIDTLNKKALVIETKLSKEVQSKWKQALTQTSTTTTKKSGHGDRLSRLAYRWVKGIAGWSRSTIGQESEDDKVPSAEPGDRPEQISVGEQAQQTNHSASLSAPRSDQGEIDSIAQAWADLWQTSKVYEPLDFHGGPRTTDR